MDGRDCSKTRALKREGARRRHDGCGGEESLQETALQS